MKKKSNSISSKAGLPPGSLVYVGKYKSTTSKLSVIDYSGEEFSETECKNIEDCFPFKDKDSVSWINLNGISDTEAISSIGNHFGLHPLLLEDILNTKHRPKLEEFEGYIFLTFKMLSLSEDSNLIQSEQISLVLGNNWVLSFQEKEGDVFDTLRKRLEGKKGRIRDRRADYLVYRLVDTVVDHYFFISEYISESMEILEEKVLKNPGMETLEEIQSFKRELIILRKVVSPLREAVSTLQKDSNPFVEESTTRYFRDVYEHIIHISESIDSQRDILGGIMDMYLSGVSNKMNRVMQVLTIVATIFIPLTFVAGIYGMNFEYMPELKWKYGYFVVWGIMIAILGIMLIFFKRKRWL